MRLLLISAEFPPLEGGVGDYTACLAGALAATGPPPAGLDAGIEVAVLTGPEPSAAGAPQARPGDLPAPLRAPSGPGAAVRVLRAVRRWDWSLLPAVRATVLVWRPDVLHVQYQTAAYGMHPAINLLPLWLAAAVPTPARPRVVTTFHDLRPPYLFPKAGPVRELAAPLLAATSDAFVVTAPEALASRGGRYLARLAPASFARAHLIPIGSAVAPVVMPAESRAAWRARLGAGPETFLIGHFGLVNPTKGLDDLLRAVARLVADGRDVRLAVIGGTPGASDPTNRAWLDHVRALAGALRLEPHLTWTGFLPEAEAGAALQALDAAALPYRDGATFQRSTLQAALAHGLPTVTTGRPHEADAGPTRERVPARRLPSAAAPLARQIPRLRDGTHALLVPAGDPTALAAALARLAVDPSLRAHLAAGARHLAERFAWPTIAARHRHLYSILLAQTKAPSPAGGGGRGSGRPG